MNPGPTWRRSILGIGLCVAALVVARPESSAAQKFLKFGLGDKTVNYKSYKDPAGRFEVDVPTKDWRTTSGGSTLALFSRNDGAATLAIDYLRLTAELAPSQLGTMTEVEIQDLKERHPQAKDFTSELMESKAGRGAMIRYVNAGSKEPERVMQFSIPVGKDLFRVIAVAPVSSLAKHEAVLMHMLESFNPTTTATSSKD